MNDDVSADFVFGTLATDDLRLAQLRASGSGLHHGHDLEPADPDPGVPVTIGVMLGRVLGVVVGKRAEIIGGIVLMLVGAVILYEHLSAA